MKRFFKGLLILVAVLGGVFVIGGLLLPSEWKVSRSLVIEAPVDAIYAQVSNLRNWQNWSPWTKEKDPTQEYAYEGPESGVGAKWLWTSQNMGTGWLEIQKADPAQGIAYELFIDMGNMQSTIHGDMVFQIADGKVEITWSDSGSSGNNLLKRWMSLLMDGMLGGELEQGLAKLKMIVEKK